MAFGCGLTVCKWILGFFNFLIFVCGGIILGVGVWITVDKQSILSLLRNSQKFTDSADAQNVGTTAVLEQLGYILIAVGAVIFLLGFLGCCGACQESKCMLATYAVFLTIFLLVEVGAGIYAAVAKKDFVKDSKKLLLQSLQRYKGDDEKQDALSLSWNYVFANFKCCGVNNAEDLRESEWYKNKPNKNGIPKQCCKLKGDPSNFEPEDPTCPTLAPLASYPVQGCVKAIEDWANTHLNIVIGVAIGLGLVQLLAVIFACCLCSAINN